MAHDKRFALIDKAGRERFAAFIAGSFQIGKDRKRLPTDLETFVRAILLEGEGGRFICANGTMPAVLKYSTQKDLQAVGYRLDPLIAARLGISAQGRR